MPSSAVLSKFQHGELHSGSKSGPVVHNHKQAVAIYLSEQQEEAANGGVYPEAEKKRAAKRRVIEKG